jgi:hypothetical protein
VPPGGGGANQPFVLLPGFYENLNWRKQEIEQMLSMEITEVFQKVFFYTE